MNLDYPELTREYIISNLLTDPQVFSLPNKEGQKKKYNEDSLDQIQGKAMRQKYAEPACVPDQNPYISEKCNSGPKSINYCPFRSDSLMESNSNSHDKTKGMDYKYNQSTERIFSLSNFSGNANLNSLPAPRPMENKNKIRILSPNVNPTDQPNELKFNEVHHGFSNQFEPINQSIPQPRLIPNIQLTCCKLEIFKNFEFHFDYEIYFPESNQPKANLSISEPFELCF